MTLEDVKRDIITKLRSERLAKKQAEKQAQQTWARQRKVQTDRFSALRPALEEIASCVDSRRGVGTRISFSDTGVEIRLRTGSAGPKRSGWGEAVRTWNYFFDLNEGCFVLKYIHQSSATDQTASSLKRFIYGIFGDPEPRTKIKRFFKEEDLLKDFGDSVLEYSNTQNW